jgi:uncharacterized protein
MVSASVAAPGPTRPLLRVPRNHGSLAGAYPPPVSTRSPPLVNQVMTAPIHVPPEQAERFWRRLWQLRPRYPGLHIRDLERFGEWLRRARSGISRVASLYDPIPAVSAAGHVVVLSPELLGTVAPAHRNFIVGDVLTESLLSIMNRLPTVGYVAEFERGLQACARTCEFWDFCRGGQASNRFFEHGRFDTTETNYCRTTYQAVVRSALQQIKGGIL